MKKNSIFLGIIVLFLFFVLLYLKCCEKQIKFSGKENIKSKIFFRINKLEQPWVGEPYELTIKPMGGKPFVDGHGLYLCCIEASLNKGLIVQGITAGEKHSIFETTDCINSNVSLWSRVDAVTVIGSPNTPGHGYITVYVIDSEKNQGITTSLINVNDSPQKVSYTNIFSFFENIDEFVFFSFPGEKIKGLDIDPMSTGIQIGMDMPGYYGCMFYPVKYDLITLLAKQKRIFRLYYQFQFNIDLSKDSKEQGGGFWVGLVDSSAKCFPGWQHFSWPYDNSIFAIETVVSPVKGENFNNHLSIFWKKKKIGEITKNKNDLYNFLEDGQIHSLRVDLEYKNKNNINITIWLDKKCNDVLKACNTIPDFSIKLHDETFFDVKKVIFALTGSTTLQSPQRIKIQNLIGGFF